MRHNPSFFAIVFQFAIVSIVSACGAAPSDNASKSIPAPATEESAPVPATQEPSPIPTLPEPTSVSTMPQPDADPVVIEESQPIAGGPVLLRNDISLRKVVDVGGASIRLAWHPLEEALYYLHPSEGIFLVNLSEPSSAEKVVEIADITAGGSGWPTGMAFGPDGMLYVVMNRKPDNMTVGMIYKGTPTEQGEFSWELLAESEPYPISGTPFDHLFGGVVISPDNQWVFISSGSRTDHGEVEDNGGSFPNEREVDLTARIFRIPTDVAGLVIPNDESAQVAEGLLFAAGTRNAYDLEIAPNGDLFAIDNGPDADYPDELNWIREGEHYGFPWRFGSQDNPQQYPDYDASSDKLLSDDFVAVQLGTYQNDPDFPPAPGPFTDPVVNLGPDAAQYRGEDGEQHDAAEEGKPLHTFTAHRSPLGLVFVTDEEVTPDLSANEEALNAFILSWGAAGGTLSDAGQDLLHLSLTKREDNYESVTTQIARDFKNPIDAVIIGNQLYVLEYGADGAIWELTFE